MSDGRIHYAECKGNYLLKFSGDVRVTLCTTLKKYIERIFGADDMESVIVDLREAKAVDSTTLGFMAKVAIYANDRNIKPLLISDDASMIRLVEGMGFDEIFTITHELPCDTKKLKEMKCVKVSTEEARAQVIEAHETLMSMNHKNMHTFSSLVKVLEREADSSRH